MAHIIDDVINKSAGRSTLEQVDFSRQVDVYKLAVRGDPQMRRLWNDFQSAAPELARLVIAYDSREKAGRQDARKYLDGMLTKAEAKPRKAKIKPPKPPRPSLKAMVRADLNSPDPHIRETARRLLAGM